jgi:hypothetical protein
MNLPQAFANARSTFPNFPEEIFRLWLDDRICHSGWPPNGPEWEGFLFGRCISRWQQVVWEKDSFAIAPDSLSSTAFTFIRLIVDAAVGDRENVMSMYIPDSKDRFNSALSYVQKNGVLPGTVLLLEGADGYDIVDGNHRIAALLANWSQTSQVQPPNVNAWVAR